MTKGMDILFTLFDILLHLDQYLPGIIQAYGYWTYPILFAIIFLETGFVITPYLPGDSLLFVAGAIAGTGYLRIELLLLVLIAAAVLGDSANYWIGHTFGMNVIEKRFNRLINKDHLLKTEQFFKKYGGLTIVIARFVPFIRTFAPFVAGIGKMQYRWFLTYNVVGGILWVSTFLSIGYFFGGLPIVREYFNYIIYIIIGLSLLIVVSIIFGLFRTVAPKPQ